MKMTRLSANFSLREVLDLLIEASYLAIIFFVPLCFSWPWFPTYNVFELNKIILFESLFWLSFFFTALKLIFYWPIAPFASLSLKAAGQLMKKYWLVPALFILGLGLSLFFSINPAQSFYGSYDHQAGLLSYLYYFGFFVLLSFNLLSIANSGANHSDSLAKRIRRLILAVAMSGFVVSLYGILQIFNVDFLTWAEAPSLTHRALSTFGQPNFLASFLLLIIPLDLYLLIQAKSWAPRVLYLIFSLATLLCLFFTASRGALVALVFAALIALIFAWRNWKKALIYFILTCAIALSFLAGWHYFLASHLADVSDLATSSVAARLDFYGAAARAIEQKPFFGYGLENAGEVFIRYYRPDWGLYANVGASTDRAHNLILDILLSAGLWGLLLFAGLYYYFFRVLKRLATQPATKSLALALGFGVLAYLLSLMFSFSLVVAEIYFWLFLAMAIALDFSVESTVAPTPQPLRVNALKFLAVILVAFFVAWRIYLGIQTLSGDHYFFKLTQTLNKKTFFTGLVLKGYVDETQPNPVLRDYYNIFWYDDLSALEPAFYEKSVQVISRAELLQADKNLARSGFTDLLVKGRVVYALGHYPLALNYFQTLIRLTPFWPPAALEEARTYSAQGNTAQAISAYQQALADLPDLAGNTLSQAHIPAYQYYFYTINQGLGDAYTHLGDAKRATAYYKNAARVQDPAYFK